MSKLILLGGAGKKKWSGDPADPDPELMKPGSTVYVVGGRAVYRHISDKGSVMHWTDKSGVVHKTLVLDAQYRAAKYWGSGAVPSGMTPYTNSYYYLSTGTTSSDSNYDTTQKFDSNPTKFKDSVINAYSGYFEDNHSSNYNTSKMITQWPSSSYAANWCRANGSGIVCDLPNIQTLTRIYICAEKINALDSTKGSYPNFALSGWKVNGNSYAYWSSTVYSSYSAWYVDYNSNVGYYTQYKYQFGCCPVLEL